MRLRFESVMMNDGFDPFSSDWRSDGVNEPEYRTGGPPSSRPAREAEAMPNPSPDRTTGSGPSTRTRPPESGTVATWTGGMSRSAPKSGPGTGFRDEVT